MTYDSSLARRNWKLAKLFYLRLTPALQLSIISFSFVLQYWLYILLSYVVALFNYSGRAYKAMKQADMMWRSAANGGGRSTLCRDLSTLFLFLALVLLGMHVISRFCTLTDCRRCRIYGVFKSKTSNCIFALPVVWYRYCCVWVACFHKGDFKREKKNWDISVGIRQSEVNFLIVRRKFV